MSLNSCFITASLSLSMILLRYEHSDIAGGAAISHKANTPTANDTTPRSLMVNKLFTLIQLIPGEPRGIQRVLQSFLLARDGRVLPSSKSPGLPLSQQRLRPITSFTADIKQWSVRPSSPRTARYRSSVTHQRDSHVVAEFNASLALGTVSAGFTLYQASMIVPVSSTRKDDRMIPS